MHSGVNAGIAIFASGGGSNADKICTYFKSHPTISVNLIVSNRMDAGVFKVAASHAIPTAYFPKKTWAEQTLILDTLHHAGVTHIVLAGYLLLLPSWLIQHFNHRIINIHPSLLPRHGGQGMYGHHVHEAVKHSGELISGMTIHEVNEKYDEGKILFQKEVSLDKNDTAEDIAKKVLQAEHAFYASIIERWISNSPS